VNVGVENGGELAEEKYVVDDGNQGTEEDRTEAGHDPHDNGHE
jgi:hypothetical protein